MPTQLYAITPDWDSLSDPIAQIEALLQAGCKIIQYRDKAASSTQRHYRARLILDICQQHQAKLIINDDLDLALAIKANGVHLGTSDGEWLRAKQRLGDKMIFGVTCHDRRDLLQKASEVGVSYVAFGSLFASVSKPQAKIGSWETFTSLCAVAAEKAIKTCAIGGITLENLPQVLQLRPDYIAVISGIFNGNNQQISDNFENFQRALNGSKSDAMLQGI